MSIRVYDDADQLAAAAAELLVGVMREKRGRLLLAGGEAPRRVYHQVAQLATAAEFKGVHVFFVDERMVPVDHFESTCGMIKRAWLEPARFPPERIHRIAGELDAERAARLAEEELRSVTGGSPRMDLALLGLGNDGHTASLFPGADELDDTDRLYIPARGATRVTATLGLINACESIVFVVSGARKAEAVHAALHDPPGSVPASLVGSPERPPMWLLDRAAASLLP